MRSLTPFRLSLAVTVMGIAAAAITLVLGLSQISLGLDFAVSADGQNVEIVGIDAADLEHLRGVRVVGIAPAEGTTTQVIPITPQTLIEEPDKLNDGDLIAAFRQEQGAINALLRAPEVILLTERDGARESVTIPTAPSRPLGDMPLGFWAQLFTGFAGLLIGGWIWALRPGSASHQFLFMTGFGLALSAFAAAIYSSRELALATAAYNVLAPLNVAGALLFGAGLIGIFLRYPIKLVANWLCWLPLPLLFAPLIASLFGATGNPVYFLHLPIVVALVAILVLLLVQWFKAGHDAIARAALRLVATGVAIGAGGFVFTTTLPALFGIDSRISQALSFPLFLFVFAGVALAVRRHRFFDLERWSLQLLFYIGGGLVLIALDAILVLLLSVDRRPALAVALVTVTLFYLPIRDRLARRLTPGRGDEVQLSALIRTADEIALSRDPAKQLQLWKDFLADEFDALSVEPVSMTDSVTPVIADEGAALVLPPVSPLPAIRLTWNARGRRLFSRSDLRKATDITNILRQLIEGRQAFESGMNEERNRIARDVHDNLGMRLTSALRQQDSDHKNLLIRETFADLRRILTEDNGEIAQMDEVLADLRVELSDYLDAIGREMDWPLTETQDVMLSASVAQSLRAVLRESVHNAARHSDAERVSVGISLSDSGFSLSVRNQGSATAASPLEPGSPRLGQGGTGIENMRRRIEGVGGRLEIRRLPKDGFEVFAQMPFIARSPDTNAADRASQLQAVSDL